MPWRNSASSRRKRRAAIWAKARDVDFRRRAHRRDRTRNQARRHRLPHPSGRDRRARSAFRAPGHDLVRRARHLSQRPAGARRGSADRRCRPGAGRAEKTRLRAQDDADHRPLATASMPSPSRSASSSPRPYAEFTRARARLVAAREEVATCAISGAVGTFAQIDPRVEEHVAQGMGLKPEPVSTQVIPRDRHAMYFRHAWRDRRLGRAARHRDPASAAHRGARGGGVLLRGPEGLLGDAAQAQPGADGESHRPCRAWCAPM